LTTNKYETYISLKLYIKKEPFIPIDFFIVKYAAATICASLESHMDELSYINHFWVVCALLLQEIMRFKCCIQRWRPGIPWVCPWCWKTWTLLVVSMFRHLSEVKAFVLKIFKGKTEWNVLSWQLTRTKEPIKKHGGKMNSSLFL